MQYPQKYSYFRTSASQDSPVGITFPGYSCGMLSNSLNRERFELDSAIRLVIGGGTIVYTVGITFQDGDPDGSTKMLRRVSALAQCTKGSFKDEGLVLETLPHFMKADPGDDSRNIRFLINRSGGKLPRHIDTCLRLIAGVFNYLLDLGIPSRGTFGPMQLVQVFNLGLISTAGLVRWFMTDPVYDYVSDVLKRVSGAQKYKANGIAEAAARVLDELDHTPEWDLSDSFMNLDLNPGWSPGADSPIGIPNRRQPIPLKNRDSHLLWGAFIDVLRHNRSVVHKQICVLNLGQNWTTGKPDYAVRLGLEFDPNHNQAPEVDGFYSFARKKLNTQYTIYSHGGGKFYGEIYIEAILEDEDLVRNLADLALREDAIARVLNARVIP